MGSGGALAVNKGFNFAQPGRKEAYWITALSLGIAAIFWMICLYSASTGHGTLSIIENGLESLLDFGSTAIVLYRLSEPDALRHSVRNEIMEARVSVLLGFVMTILGLALCVLSALSLVYADHIGPGDISIEAALSVPASLMYIVVGMLQLQIAWALDLRSLKQDAIISLLGALIAMGSLAAALTNLIQWVNQDVAMQDIQTSFSSQINAVQEGEGTTHGGATSILEQLMHAIALSDHASGHPQVQAQQAAQDPAAASIDDQMATIVRNETYGFQQAQAAHYKYWWLEDILTILTATVLVLCGCYFIHDDVSSGREFWTSSFWLAPLPPGPEDTTGAGGDDPERRQRVNTENTPLKAP